MAIDYTYAATNRLIVVAWDQNVSLQEWQAHLERMFVDPNYSQADYQLVDMRFAIIGPSITEAQIRRIVAEVESKSRLIIHKKLAIVAGSDWDKIKLFEKLIEPYGVRPVVFTNLLTACTWIGADVIEVGEEVKRMRLGLRENV